MNIKTILTAFGIFLIFSRGIYAQQAVMTTGGDATGSGGSVSYSIGQVADTTNQGVQQPYEFASVGVEDNAAISLYCSVYPNPAAAYVTLRVDLPVLLHLRYELFDLNGKLLFNNTIVSNETTIHLEKLPVAIYMLNVSDNNTILEAFKIIKNQ